MERACKILLAVWLSSLMVGCSAGASASPSVAAPVATAAAPAMASPVDAPTVIPGTKEAMPAFPQCTGMQKLSEPVNFDWPNLNEHRQEFFRSQWTYFICQEPASEVAASYRQHLPKPPYAMDETNWLERPEGSLGVFFSQKGAWDYIWFIPQPENPQASYLIVAETFAYVEC